MALTTAVAAALAACSPGSPSPEPRRDAARLGEYRVVYRVEETAGARPVVSTETLTVRRPFDARVEKRRGAPPGGALDTVFVTNRDFLWHVQQGGASVSGSARPPGFAHRDASFAAFADAARAGQARRSGRLEVQGTACTRFVHRSVRPDAIEPATAAERVETCITPDGIVLQETWSVGGRRVLQWRAVEVDRRVDDPSDQFFLGRQPTDQEAQLVLRTEVVNDADVPAAKLAVDLPDGFTPDRAARVSRSAAGPSISVRVASHLRGTDLLAVEEATLTGDRTPPWPAAEGQSVDLGPNGSATAVYYADRVEVRVVSPPFAPELAFRVTGPTRALAVQVARSARRAP